VGERDWSGGKVVKHNKGVGLMGRNKGLKIEFSLVLRIHTHSLTKLWYFRA